MNLLLKNQRNLDKNILWLELLNTTDILHVQQGTCISACVRTGVNVTWQQYFHRVMAFCKLDVCGSVHHSTILTEKPNKMQQCIKILLFLILNEAQHVSGDTPPIIRSLKLHKQPLVLHNTVEGCRTCSCWTLSSSICYLTTSNNCTSNNLP